MVSAIDSPEYGPSVAIRIARPGSTITSTLYLAGAELAAVARAAELALGWADTTEET